MAGLDNGAGVLASVANTWTANQTFDDNVKLLFGTEGDVSLLYDGAKFIIDHDVVASGATTVFNDAGADVDFLVKTDNDANAFAIDGGLDIAMMFGGSNGVQASQALALYKDWGEPDGTRYGMYVRPVASETTGATGNQFVGIVSEMRIGGTANSVTNTQNWTDGVAVQSFFGYLRTMGGSTGTITGAAVYYAGGPAVSGAAITNYYGVYVGNITGATNNYGLYIVDAGTASIALASDDNDEAGGILFRSDGSVNLYSGGAGELTTSDAFRTHGSNFTAFRHSDNASPPSFIFSKSRGTEGSPTLVQGADQIGLVRVSAYDGAGYDDEDSIRWTVGGDWSATSHRYRIDFFTNASGATGGTNQLRIDEDGGIFMYNLLQQSSAGLVAEWDSSTKELYAETSTQRSKKNIRALDFNIDGMYELAAKSYEGGERNLTQFGFIAEEVQEVLPQLVVLDEGGDPLGVAYQKLPVLMIEEMKRLRNRNEELEGVK